MPGPKPRPASERFWCKVDQSAGPAACWPWLAGIAGRGYGQFYRTKDRPVGAHRFSYELHYGRIPDGLHVCHHCDNPPCVNPAHLFVGTAADNMRDKSWKGRNPGNRTDRGRKLHAIRGDDAVAALAMVMAGQTQRSVARHFGVSPAAVCRGLQVARIDSRNVDLARERVGMFLTDVIVRPVRDVRVAGGRL